VTDDNPLADAVDIHIHSAPDIFPRCVTATQAGEMARDAGMAAIVVKSHSTDTSARAAEATERTGFPVFGGVALNYSVGGLNPYAVLESARQGGRVVWFPTLGARHFVQHADLAGMLKKGIPPGVEGITILRPDGGLKPEVNDILDIIAENNTVICTGHVSPQEATVLTAAALDKGIRRVVVTHPQAPFVDMNVADMSKNGEAGAFLEFTPQLDVAKRAALIRAVGVRHCFISTDGGTVTRPAPVIGLRDYIQGLADEGFTREELHYMTVSVPSYLLGLKGFEELPAAPLRDRSPSA
jgi:Family of unknown function (DUF6282)